MDVEFYPGQRVGHVDYGVGAIVERPRDGFVRVFFSSGERQVPVTALRPLLSREERILEGVAGTPDRLRKIWLSLEAHALPLMESAAALTAAKIDLLPHQVVLTHRIATTSPRRYLIADEVGLGKTIETALILRELASRGELSRALLVVPAGLLNNWHRELNEVFNLGFEVFGSEGDVTDRKSNAFAKHNLLIASIDSLKRPARVARLLEAPHWDLVAFDEAHHLTAYRSGNKVRKTANYKLAEVLKSHTRDLLLLSATPHQGDHFRFWMLIQLLNPTLFNSPKDMVEHRHRLNAVVFRRTKADACRADGAPLFARRWVHTESFIMSDAERNFYARLRSYLEDGFALAKRQGNEGRGLGFVMAIFQKIAASSFAAVRRTLRRRLLMLTIHEGVLKDRVLDIDGREQLFEEARQLIRDEYGFGNDQLSRGEVDRALADSKLKLLKKMNEAELELVADEYGTEFAASHAEDLAASTVTLALPEERLRIRDLLAVFPNDRETKAQKLLQALGTLWKQNPDEKVVVFATYLGTVDLLGKEIETTYPGQGVVVLRGGDHAAKLTAERRFAQKTGPKVLVCTAAGREGINLQNARILFNFDLPWNPMDVEQRIGRIHRYGQIHTAQVYNLVLSDTIEGRIFLLLNEKLHEIAKTLGKIDEHGHIAEDLRTQILGQLSERLSYERLYQEALSDPELRRTQFELETALSNATEARKVVFELFQDLEGFRLEDYKPFADVSRGIERIVHFFGKALEGSGQKLVAVSQDTFDVRDGKGTTIARFTRNRECARDAEGVDLLGLDHPMIQTAIERWRDVSPDELGGCVQRNNEHGVVTWWFIEGHGKRGEQVSQIVPLAIATNGARIPALERTAYSLIQSEPAAPCLSIPERIELLRSHAEPMVQREAQQRGLVHSGGFSARLLAWIET